MVARLPAQHFGRVHLSPLVSRVAHARLQTAPRKLLNTVFGPVVQMGFRGFIAGLRGIKDRNPIFDLADHQWHSYR